MEEALIDRDLPDFRRYRTFLERRGELIIAARNKRMLWPSHLDSQQ
jgi:hypothetical protein